MLLTPYDSIVWEKYKDNENNKKYYYKFWTILITSLLRLVKVWSKHHHKGGRTTWRYSVFANILGGDTVIWMKNGRYSVFQSTNGDGKIQFLIENTTVTGFVQKFVYGITVIFEKINGNTVIQSLVRPPLILDL